MSNDKFAVLLCKFTDDQNEPRERKFYEMLFTHAGAGTSNLPLYFNDISHNHLDTNGSEVFGWFTMNKKVSDYVGSGANQQGRNNLITWARDAATSNGVDLQPFGNRIVVCINRGLETFGGGTGAVLDDFGLEPGVAGQEMLHTFGLDHSRLEGQGDYTDPYDIMSAWSTSRPTQDPLYGRVGPITCAANMDFLGWLDPVRVWRASGELKPTQVTLRPLARPNLQGYVAAKIGDYYVEFRMNEGWDAAIGPPCVLVHTFGAGKHSYLMLGDSGQQGLAKGDRFSRIVGPIDTKIEVADIDPIARTATIQASQFSLGPHVAHH